MKKILALSLAFVAASFIGCTEATPTKKTEPTKAATGDTKAGTPATK
jgi:hypothetical protein